LPDLPHSEDARRRSSSSAQSQARCLLARTTHGKRTHLGLIRCEVYPKQLPPKDGQPGKVISGYRWTHVELTDKQLAEVEQARKASKIPSLADALK
jgi:hypothetical protein